MIGEGMISPQDLSLMRVTDSIDEVVSICESAAERQWTED
jgi:predicted Rossmann-fold nucleotide-binding protein